jgi:hypothetical protein
MKNSSFVPVLFHMEWALNYAKVPHGVRIGNAVSFETYRPKKVSERRRD